MARYYQRPDNALKRATEFIEVGKPTRALDTLYDVIKNKRSRTSNVSEKILEPIMLKYLDLCVELKKSHIAKEGLFQYRNICQAVNVASLETVVRKYLEQAEERTENAREQSHQAVVDIDDLDNLITPEQILLSAVSGEDTQARTDRAILTPWVKFLWESYRQCLELLRTNARVERLYHEIAQQYNRKTEFRKLCDNLRLHLQIIFSKQQQAVTPTVISLNNSESLQMNMETRLAQLDTAIQLELWQEAYKATEDIHGLMTMSKAKSKPQMMANYYQKLSLVFWKAGNFLFHAAALFKIFLLSKEQKKNLTSSDIQRMASQVLVATLTVPLPSAHPEFDRFIETERNAMDKVQRLALLLGLSSPPTRQVLVRDLVRLSILQYVPAELQILYHWLEEEFHPLCICKRVQESLQYLQTCDNTRHLVHYISALQEITLIRLVKQVAQVYETIEMDRLLDLACFSDSFRLEKVIVDLARHNDMQVRIDHRERCLHFGKDLSEAQREDIPEGAILQTMPSEQVRTQLMSMHEILHQCVALVEPQRHCAERQQLRIAIHETYHAHKNQNRMRIFERKRIIEDHKERMENYNNMIQEEERRAQEEQLQRHLEAEQIRLQREAEERELRRREDEKREISLRHMKDRLEQLSQTAIGQKIIAKMDEEELYRLDADAILQKQVEELQKERQELQQKLKAQFKKIDHLERAKRLEEIPLLQKAAEEWKIKDRELWDQQEKERIEELRHNHEIALQNHYRLQRMRSDASEFLSQLKVSRHKKWIQEVEEFEKVFNEEKEARLEQRKIERKQARHEEWLKKKEEIAKKIKEEEAQKAKELQEEEERKKIAYLKKLDEQAEIQRRRDREIEEKLKARYEETSKDDRERKVETSEPWKPSHQQSNWRKSDEKMPWYRKGNELEGGRELRDDKDLEKDKNRDFYNRDKDRNTGLREKTKEEFTRDYDKERESGFSRYRDRPRENIRDKDTGRSDGKYRIPGRTSDYTDWRARDKEPDDARFVKTYIFVTTVSFYNRDTDWSIKKDKDRRQDDSAWNVVGRNRH